MVSSILLLRPSCSLYPLSLPRLSKFHLTHGLLSSKRVHNYTKIHLLRTQKARKVDFSCCYKKKEKLDASSTEKSLSVKWSILERWDIPWQWQTIFLTMVACGVSLVLTGLVEASALQYLGLQGAELSLDQKAEVIFVGQFTVTAVVLGIIYGITNTFQPFPDDLFRYELKEPFDLRRGWLLWAGIGLISAVITVSLASVALTAFSDNPPQRDTDALIRLLPLIGSSSISTACLVGVTGVLAPVLEETVFRGFLMASLTKWVPTPISIVISAALFALAHLTPGQFPQLFILGTALGLSYAQTRNLMTPITIHAFWNSGVIILLTILQLQGYDIRELLQGS